MNFIPNFQGRRLFIFENPLPFVKFSRLAFMISMAAMALSLAIWGVFGLNFGVDFNGGSMIEMRSTSGPANISQLRNKAGSLGLGDVQITSFGSPQDVLIRVEQQSGGEKAQQEALGKIVSAVGAGYEQRRVEVVGPAVSGELRQTGIIAVLCSILAIIAYVWFRFEWQFAIGAVVALTHDVLITIGVFSLMQFEFDLSTVAALLTILGYSVNDTVVVADRIRENLRKYKRMDLPALLNQSINETLSRTLMTSLTTLIVLIALYVLGGEVIRNFTFAMMFGVVIGTYSSIFIAAPLLQFLGVKRDWSGVTKGAPAASQ
ncbi:MAG: preprotein translocase subunit SecF [Hyphomicrobiaceae bacterium]|jgi:preprotein translocase subunit SecF